MQANRRSTYRDEKNLQVAAAAAAGSDVHYRRIVIQHVVRSDYWLAASCQRHQVVVGMETLSYERRRWQRHDGCADDGRAQHHVLLAVARHSEMVHHRAVTSFWQWHATLRWFIIAPSRPSNSGTPLWDGSPSRRPFSSSSPLSAIHSPSSHSRTQCFEILSEFGSASSSSEPNVPQVVDELHPKCAGSGWRCHGQHWTSAFLDLFQVWRRRQSLYVIWMQVSHHAYLLHTPGIRAPTVFELSSHVPADPIAAADWMSTIGILPRMVWP